MILPGPPRWLWGLTLNKLAFVSELLHPAQGTTQRTCFSGQPCQVVALSVLALLSTLRLLGRFPNLSETLVFHS